LGSETSVHGPILPLDFQKKRCLGPQNGSGSSRPEKLLKIVSCATIKETENAKRNNVGDPGGLGRWPPISTSIIKVGSLGSFIILVVIPRLITFWCYC